MIELQHHRIDLSAIDAGMCPEIIEKSTTQIGSYCGAACAGFLSVIGGVAQVVVAQLLARTSSAVRLPFSARTIFEVERLEVEGLAAARTLLLHQHKCSIRGVTHRRHTVGKKRHADVKKLQSGSDSGRPLMRS
ncbi:MAG: hypothetical protein JO057_18755 [Chloroflexi bacterium]|nr:hypothetical protein [Chloroflexota bacterium]